MGGEAGGGCSSAGLEYKRAKTSVWWDIENCQVPRGCDAHAIAQNISSALVKLDYGGPVSISAYGDTNGIPISIQQALSSTGISLNHVPAGAKDASDKKILVDMLFWAVDNPAPANYLLISGDRDFANALHQLRMRRYNILLAQPVQASVALVAAAKSVWLWTSLVDGGPPRSPNDPPAPSLADANNHRNPDISQPSNSTNMNLNNQTSTDPHHKFDSPGRTVGGDPRNKGKHVRRTPAGQPGADKAPSVASGSPESENVHHSCHSDHTEAKTRRKAPREFFGANQHIAFAGGSPSSGFPANMDPSARDKRDYVAGTQQTPFVHNSSARPSLQKAPRMPSGVPESRSASNGFPGNLDPSALCTPDFVGRPHTHPPHLFRPTAVPVHSNYAPGNLYPPNANNHAFHPVAPRPGAAPLRPPFTNAPDIAKLYISERSNFAQNSPNQQYAARPEFKNTSHKYSSAAIRNASQKCPNTHANHSYNCSTPNGSWAEPGCNMSSLPTANVLSGACGQQGAVTAPPPSEYEQGLAGVILLALDNLRNEKIMPTEANIADCIRFGDLKHRNTDVTKALDCAVKQNMVVKQRLGQVQLYVIKNQLLWKCVNPMGGSPNEYPKATWDGIQEFLATADGRSAITSSTCRYEAALVLKNLCLQDLSLGQVLHILNLLITIKRWIKHHPSGWKPVTITLPEGDNEAINSAGTGTRYKII